LTASVLLLVSCKVPNSISGFDSHGFETRGNIIYHKDKPFAEIQQITYSLDNRKFVKELNFKLLDVSKQDLIPNMMKHLYKKTRKFEIEVEMDMDEVKL